MVSRKRPLSCLVQYSAAPPFAGCQMTANGISHVDGAAYKLHGQKLAGIAFNREWNNVGETAAAAAAGNRFHSGMVRATNDPWSCAVTDPMARNLKLWFAFVRPSAATIPSSSADAAVLLWVML